MNPNPERAQRLANLEADCEHRRQEVRMTRGHARRLKVPHKLLQHRQEMSAWVHNRRPACGAPTARRPRSWHSPRVCVVFAVNREHDGVHQMLVSPCQQQLARRRSRWELTTEVPVGARSEAPAARTAVEWPAWRSVLSSGAGTPIVLSEGELPINEPYKPRGSPDSAARSKRSVSSSRRVAAVAG